MVYYMIQKLGFSTTRFSLSAIIRSCRPPTTQPYHQSAINLKFDDTHAALRMRPLRVHKHEQYMCMHTGVGAPEHVTIRGYRPGC